VIKLKARINGRKYQTGEKKEKKFKSELNKGGGENCGRERKGGGRGKKTRGGGGTGEKRRVLFKEGRMVCNLTGRDSGLNPKGGKEKEGGFVPERRRERGKLEPHC